jgi:hypothetical protein
MLQYCSESSPEAIPINPPGFVYYCIGSCMLLLLSHGWMRNDSPVFLICVWPCHFPTPRHDYGLLPCWGLVTQPPHMISLRGRRGMSHPSKGWIPRSLGRIGFINARTFMHDIQLHGDMISGFPGFYVTYCTRG